MTRVAIPSVLFFSLSFVFCFLFVNATNFPTGGGPAVQIASVQHIGNQSDPHNIAQNIYLYRDGGAVGSVGGKIVWLWSDTTQDNSAGTFTGFYGNTGAVSSSPLVMNGTAKQAIPFTATEQAFNNAHGNNPRVVLWAKSGITEISAGLGLVFVPKDYWGSTSGISAPNPGIVVANVTLGKDGYPVITRYSDVPLFPKTSNSNLYGNMAATKDDTYIYLYSGDSGVFVARALLAQATDVTKYTYWHADVGQWQTTAPAQNQTAAALFSAWLGVDGSVFYSAYHKAWLMIYQYHADTKVYYRTALAPQGPFGGETLAYTAPTPTNPNVHYIYGTSATNLYDPSGKSAIVDFTWCPPGNYVNWVIQIKWN